MHPSRLDSIEIWNSGIRGPVAHPDTLRTIALEAEELGFVTLALVTTL